jgi:formyl-CoA transferase/CoA:oxalate CoA-transferase
VPAQTFAAADGYVSIFVGNDPMWARFVTALDDPRAADPAWLTTAGRYEHRAAVIGCLQGILAQRPAAEWVDRLTAHGVPCAPVNGIAEALADPQVGARGMVATVAAGPPAGNGVPLAEYRCVRGPLPTAAPAPTAGAPSLGQHTAEVLAELGYGPDRLRELHDGGVISGAPHLDGRMAHR